MTAPAPRQVVDTLPDAAGRRFGWRPPGREEAARLSNQYAYDFVLPLALPAAVDLRRDCPPVYDQEGFNACTANAVAALVHYHRIKGRLSNVGNPSRLFIYWFERIVTGQQGTDAGGSVGAAIDAVAKHGYCPEGLWPYLPGNVTSSPTAAPLAASAHFRTSAPLPVPSLDQIRASLSQGNPVAFGLWIWNSFYAADQNHGVVPMPDTTQPCVPHAGLLVGYDDRARLLVMRNSWGVRTAAGRPCGDNGDYYLPYDYIAPDLSTDYWTLTSVADLP